MLVIAVEINIAVTINLNESMNVFSKTKNKRYPYNTKNINSG